MNSCDDVCPTKPIQIFQGGTKTFYVQLSYPNNGGPFDLTSLSAITTCFQNADGSELTLSLGSGIAVVGNPLLGKVSITLSAAQTTALRTVEAAGLELAVTLTGDPIKVQKPYAYSVVQSIC